MLSLNTFFYTISPDLMNIVPGEGLYVFNDGPYACVGFYCIAAKIEIHIHAIKFIIAVVVINRQTFLQWIF